MKNAAYTLAKTLCGLLFIAGCVLCVPGLVVIGLAVVVEGWAPRYRA